MKQNLKKGKKKTRFMQPSRKNKKLDLKSSAFAESTSDHIFSSKVIKDNSYSEQQRERTSPNLDMDYILMQAERTIRESTLAIEKESTVSSLTFVRELEEKENHSDSANSLEPEDSQFQHIQQGNQQKRGNNLYAVSALLVGAILSCYFIKKLLGKRKID